MKIKLIALFTVLIATSLALSACGPSGPSGKILFWDTRSDQMQSLTLPGNTPVSTPLLGYDRILGQSDGKTVIERLTGKMGDLSFWAYSPESGVEEIPTPIKTQIWDTEGYAVNSKVGPDGKINIFFRKFEDGNALLVRAYQFNGTAFVATNTLIHKVDHGTSVEADAGQYKSDLSKIILTDASGYMFYMYDKATGVMQTLSLLGKHQYDVYFSPDEKSIVYAAYDGDASTNDQRVCLVVATLDLTFQKEVYCDANYPQSFEWSPDGRSIVFHDVYPDNSNSLSILDMQSYKITQPIPVGETAVWPSWSPDSQYLAFFAVMSGEPGFWSVKADGSGLTKLYSGQDWKKEIPPAGYKGLMPISIQAWIQ